MEISAAEKIGLDAVQAFSGNMLRLQNEESCSADKLGMQARKLPRPAYQQSETLFQLAHFWSSFLSTSPCHCLHSELW